MSHETTLRASQDHITCFMFDSSDLDLSLKDFPIQDQKHLSIMSDEEVGPEIIPRGQEAQVPNHPIPSMQGAFAESMLDAFEDHQEEKRTVPADSGERRKLLLEQSAGAETDAGKWKQKPGQRYHELWKLMAQISFGIHLLLNGMARDDDQALNILQRHVDEVDAFLESTLEDFDLAQEDIDDRLRNLKLPLENIHIFDGMLEDRDFRNQIVQGNETIEHIITRTAAAMNDTLRNVKHGMDGTREFAKYMADEEHREEWQKERPEMLKLFDAMNGNADGWYKAFVLLQTKGNHLGVSLVQLGTIVAEIDRRAGEISRKTRVSMLSAQQPRALEILTSKKFSLAMSPKAPSSRSSAASPPISPPQSHRSRHSARPSIASMTTKNLPSNPRGITSAIAAALPAFQLVSERERTPAPEDESEDSELEELEDNVQYLTLQPRTYTPPPLTPSRYLPPAPRAQVVSPTPEQVELDLPLQPPARSSLRNRLSRNQKSVPPPLLTTATHSSSSSRISQASSARSASASRVSDSRSKPNSPEKRQNSRQETRQIDNGKSTTAQLTIPLSNIEFPRPPTISFNSYDDSEASPRARNLPLRSYSGEHHMNQEAHHLRLSSYENESSPDSRASSTADMPSMEYHAFIASTQPTRHDFGAAGNYVSSPRSEQHMTFQPVRASPHSPLQRPWTAAPEPRMPPGRASTMQQSSHSYNQNAYNGNSGMSLMSPNVPEVRGSNMSQMTTASEMTVGVGRDGKKVKKKRSGFGWLKKAFSLSEEEKAEFEERRRRQIEAEEEWRRANSPRERVFLDGRRVNR